MERQHKHANELSYVTLISQRAATHARNNLTNPISQRPQNHNFLINIVTTFEIAAHVRCADALISRGLRNRDRVATSAFCQLPFSLN